MTLRSDLTAVLGHQECAASLHPSLRLALAQADRELTQEREREKEEMMGKLKEVGDKFLGWFGLSTDNFKFEKQGEQGGYGLKFER